MADAKVIEKIQALLRKADPDKNPNEHEREVAERKAHELMFKHNLNLMAVTEKEGAGGVKEDGTLIDGIGNQWKGMFLFRIAKAWFCDGWYTQVTRGRSRWTIVGKPENIAFVHALYEHLVPWLEVECKAGLAKQRDYVRNPKAFKRAWFDAATARIHTRLLNDRRRMVQEADKDAPGSGTALVRVENAAVDQYMEQKELKKAKRRGYSNSAGRDGGYDAGNRANLKSTGIAKDSTRRKELGR